jgi:hypothetical protein
MNLRKWFGGGGGGTSKKEKHAPKVVQIDMNVDPDPALMKKLNYNPEHKVDKMGSKSRELPANFAKFIIEYEIKIDRPDATQEHVQKLIDLYTVSMSRHLNKCKHPRITRILR